MRDFKYYRASEYGGIGSRLAVFAGLIVLLALLGWMSDRDHQYRLDQVKAANQCEVK
ncbi:MAG: hypothetical protein IPI17_03240 [Nitrosomonas sp.]|jgi:hypothetical protein|nr:hypothetical protein [Nitrosomonas sp.]